MRNSMDHPEEQASTRSREDYQERYEQMVREFYTYQFGTISFLELLTRWEQLLGLPSPLPGPGPIFLNLS